MMHEGNLFRRTKSRQSDLLRKLWLDGACTESDTKWWQPTGPEEEQEEDARILWELFCCGCPVRAKCIEYSLSGVETGIWAGMTERTRRRLRRQRKATAA